MTIIKAVAVGASIALGVGGVVASVANPQQRDTVTIPAGTTFVAILDQELPTATSRPGDEFDLRTVRPVRLSGGMEIPVGSVITGEVIDDDNDDGGVGGGFSVRFTELVLDGDSTEIEIQTEQFRFGALSVASVVPVVVPAGRPLAIRLIRPVSVAYRPPPEPIYAAE